MLHIKNISKFTNIILDSSKYKNKKTHEKTHGKTQEKNNQIFFNETDQLFWCYYVIKNNLDNFNFINNKYTTEKEIKFKLISHIRENKAILKSLKISKNEVEDELANAKMISMKTIKVLCHLFNLNVFFIDNKKYYEIMTDVNNPIHIIEKKNKNYSLLLNISQDKIKYYSENYWKLEKLDKPLKAISSYKVSELQEICKKININYLNMTKPIMYQNILNII
tara:strand:- start:1027 stop:1692 length:666 start_codon:yes stop_codon:yes gene_type:complete